MPNRQRIIAALARSHSSHSEWMTEAEVARICCLSVQDVHSVMWELSDDGFVEFSGSTGYLRDRYRLVRQPAVALTADALTVRTAVEDPDEKRVEIDGDAEAGDVSGSMAMASIFSGLTRSDNELLVEVASIMSHDNMRALPCASVTSDGSVWANERRHAQAMEDIARETGFNIAPIGKIRHVCPSIGAAAGEAAAQGGQVAWMPRTSAGASGALPNVALRSRSGHVMLTSDDAAEQAPASCVTLPKGGLATTITVGNVQQLPGALMIRLDRRVNARSLALTRESALGLLERIPVDDLCDATFEDAVVSQRFKCPNGGNTSTSAIESIERAGSVLLLNLDRRVNARSITVTNGAARALRAKLEEAVCATA